MFAHNTSKPVHEVLHWVEQAFFAFVLLVGLGIAFYAVVSTDGPRIAADSSVRLVEVESEPGAARLAQLPSFDFHPAS